MLLTKNVAIAGDLKVPYDKVFFEYDSDAPVTKLVRKEKGEVVKINGQEFTGTQPVLSVYTDKDGNVPEHDLLDQAVKFFTDKFPSTIEYTPVDKDGKQLKDEKGNPLKKEAKVSGVYYALRMISEGFNWYNRKEVLDAAKPFDAEASANKIRKELKLQHPSWSDAKIEARIKLLQSEDEDEEAAA